MAGDRADTFSGRSYRFAKRGMSHAVSGTRRAGELTGDAIGRVARHFFLYLVLFGGACALIAGWVGNDYGVPLLFREDAPIEGFAPADLLRSPAFFSQLFATLFAGAIWMFAASLDREESRRIDQMPLEAEFFYFAIRILPTAALPLVALSFLKPATLPELAPGELDRALIGLFAGQVIVWAIIFLSRPLAALPRILANLLGLANSKGGAAASLVDEMTEIGIMRGDPLARAILDEKDGISPYEVRRLPLMRQWIPRRYILWIMFVLALVALTALPELLPAAAIFGILGMLLATYVFLNFFRENVRFFIAAGLVLLVAYASHSYQYRFPGMEAYYQDKIGLLAGSALRTEKQTGPRLKRVRFADVKAAVRKASDTMVKRALAEGGDAPRWPLPKFVVVTTSGGAYTATFWTALVLDRLRGLSGVDAPLEGIDKSIRLITGASGGMVGAAYYAALPDLAATEAQPTPLVDAILADVRPEGRSSGAGSPTDSLTPVVQQLVQGDLRHLLMPWSQDLDRGLVLERQWKALDISFARLEELELAGKSPSLIFSPMIVETGQPLLITNMDLSSLTSSQPGRALGQVMDFFEVFPESHRDFRLSTAARMSSTFPYVSPAVDLPTTPPRRVVDAGYFDNFGMNVAVAYLLQKDVRDWIARNTSGVVIVQINAYPLDPGSATTDAKASSEKCRALTAPPETQAASNGHEPPSEASGFAWLSSPIEALWASRRASMIFRNDQEFWALKEIYAYENIPITRVMFENAARSSFSWYLPERHVECIMEQWDSPRNQEELTKLVGAWQRR